MNATLSLRHRLKSNTCLLHCLNLDCLLRQKYESLLGSKTAREKICFSRTNENISRRNEKFSCNNEKFSRINEKNSRSNEKISRNNEKNSRRNEKLSRTNENISRRNEKLSRRNANISRTNEKNSRTNKKLPKRKKGDLFTSINRSLSFLNRIKLSLQYNKSIIIIVRYDKTGRILYCNLRFPRRAQTTKEKYTVSFLILLSMKHMVNNGYPFYDKIKPHVNFHSTTVTVLLYGPELY